MLQLSGAGTVTGTGEIPDDPGSNFWGNRIGVSATADAYHPDGKITGNTGTDGWNHSGALSIPCLSLASGVNLIYNAGGGTEDVFVGLSQSDVAGDNTAIEFALGQNIGSGLRNIVESGSNVSTMSAAGKNEIRIDANGEVTYWSGGDFKFLSSVTADDGLYHVAGAIHAAAGIIEGCQLLGLGNAAFWTGARSGITLHADSLHIDGAATKSSGGGVSWSNGYVYGPTFVRADAKRLTWTASVSTNDSMALGLHSALSGVIGYAMEFSFIGPQPESGRVIYIQEGISAKTSTLFADGDVFEIRVSTAGVVTYWKNGTLIYTSLTTISAGVPYAPVCSLNREGVTVSKVDLIPL